jgi:hypothetical protein
MRRHNNGINPSSSVPRQSTGSSFRVATPNDHGKNKHGLPYVPSTPSTRASSYSGSQSRHSSISDDSFETIDNSPQQQHQQHYSVNESLNRQKYAVVQQLQQSKYMNTRETELPKQRNRSESPKKRNNKSNDVVMEHTNRLSNHSRGKDYSRSQQDNHHHPAYDVPSLTTATTTPTTQNGSNHSAKLSSTSQSTSSTTSSQRQLLLPKSRSSSSFYDQYNNDQQHHQHQQQQTIMYPDYVRERRIEHDDVEDDETLFTEDDTIQTRQMIRYSKNKTTHPEQEDAMDPFLHESFESIDFGSTIGVAPLESRALLQPQQQQLHLSNPQRYDHSDEGRHCNDDGDYYYDDDYEDEMDDEALLYQNSMNEQYDGESVPSFEDDTIDEQELLHRAVRRGSAIASTGYTNNLSTDVVDQRQVVDRQYKSRGLVHTQERPQQQQQLPIKTPTNTNALRQGLRRQKSMSITSKRHLLAASARGVVPKAGSHNDIETSDTTPGKARQRGTVRKVGSYGDIETPQPQPSQSRRVGVSRMSSSDNIEISKPSPQQHQQQRQKQRGGTLTPSYHRNDAMNETQYQQAQCNSVTKAASHGDVVTNKQNRTIVRKTASHGDVELPPHQPRHGSPIRHHSIGSRMQSSAQTMQQQQLQQQPRRMGQQQTGGAATSRRRSSLEHKTMRQSSFRTNNTAADMQQRHRSYQNECNDNDYDDDVADDNYENINYIEPITLRVQQTTNNMGRRMSGEHNLMASNGNSRKQLPSGTRHGIPRAKSQSDMSMNFSLEEDMAYSNDSNINEMSFSDLAARRW